MTTHHSDSTKMPKPAVKLKGLGFRFAAIITAITIILTLPSCGKKNKKEPEVSHDPLPGELVQDALREDSLREVTKDLVQDTMTKVLTQYNETLPNKQHTRYFVTDLNHDQMPELWVRNGSARDNQRLELYFPLPGGGLKKSEIPARHSDYYLADDYIVQVMRGDPGKILVNELTIPNGNLESHVMKELDLSKDPTLKNYKVDLPEVKTSPLNNLALLNAAFEGEYQAPNLSVNIGVSGVSLDKFLTGRNLLAHQH